MTGNNTAVYMNEEFYKYYRFYQIHGYCFLGFNGNDPVDYLDFDSAEIKDGEVWLNRAPKDAYRITVTTDTESFVYNSECESYIDAVLDLNASFEGRLAQVKELKMELVEGDHAI